MTPLTREAIVRGLIAQGVPRHMAERRAAQEVGVVLASPASSGQPWVTVVPQSAPLTLRLPWSVLVSDNEMYVVGKDGKRHKTPKYVEAMEKIGRLATDGMQGRPLHDAPLAIAGIFYVPNNQRRDIHNFGATICDSLKGNVFTDDHWLHDVRWKRAGVDVDAPRCELTISPLPASSP